MLHISPGITIYILTITFILGCCLGSFADCAAGRLLSGEYSGSVVKTKIQAFYNEPISVAELGRCPR